MTFLDFFAGIGGLRVGMEKAGHTCLGFCEKDKYATASYTSMHLITELQRKELKHLSLKKRQNEILKEEYRNGEWYVDNIKTVRAKDLPKVDVWCFGSPCTSFSLAGKRKGLEGESGLIQEIFRLLRETREEDRPEWLIYENVKGMFSSNRGYDYLAVLTAMDELGYDAEWQLVNSKDFGVPHNRERVYTIGHFRGKGRKHILPLERTNGTGRNGLDAHCVGGLGKKTSNGGRQYYQQDRIYDGTTVATSLCANLPSVDGMKSNMYLIPVEISGRNVRIKQDIAHCLNANDQRKVFGAKQIRTMVGIEAKQKYQGEYIKLPFGDNLYAKWFDKYDAYFIIRRLTPKECFRLQGFSDELYKKAEFVNTPSQLWKQAGNSVTVNIVYEIAKALY